jgi:CRISPR/Cas system CSM-associated protein Csm4 (group 5 of RAMP superfamily)
MAERLKRVGKAQHSYIKKKRVKGVSFLGTDTLAETVSHLNILEKAILERKEKTVRRSPDCKSGNELAIYLQRPLALLILYL